MRLGLVSLVTAAACSGAFAQSLPVFDETSEFQVTGLSADGQAMVVSHGSNFLCSLATAEQGAMLLQGCVPILTPAQREQIDAEAAMAARLALAESDLSHALAKIAGLQGELAATQTALTRSTQERDVTVPKLEGRLAAASQDASQQRMRITELEAELDETRYMAELRGLVTDLETMSVNVGLRAPDQGEILARDGLQLAADTFSDGCVLTEEIFNANALEIQKLVQSEWLVSLGVSEKVAKLMIATDEEKLFTDDLTRFRAALDVARDMGDGPTYDNGLDALRIASTAMSKLDEATEAAVMKVVEPQADGSLRIISVPCRIR